jgi:DNA repair protein RadC
MADRELEKLYAKGGTSMAISDWPASERPRERLLAHGASALTDAELLAIFLRTGLPGKSAVDLARECLARFGGLNRLFAASRHGFCEIDGLGPAKFAQLQAVLEMSRRALSESMSHGEAMRSPQHVREYLQLSLAGKPHEEFWVLFMDARNRLIASDALFRGTLTQTSVYPREVVKHALRHNAGAVIFAHNHPSGVAEPSRADEILTQCLKSALTLIDVRVLDHVVVAGGATFSFAEHGLL